MKIARGGSSDVHPGWPATCGGVRLPRGEVTLRALRRADGAAWRTLRLGDGALIMPREASSPLSWEQRHTQHMWQAHRALLRTAARTGEALPFAIRLSGEFVGQVTIGGIQRGALRSGWVGYWVGSPFAGAGVATAAVAIAVSHALLAGGLHRVEATISPDNGASRRVVEHLGFRQEGYLERYLDINHAWRDHVLYAITAEELRGGLPGLLARWRAGVIAT